MDRENKIEIPHTRNLQVYIYFFSHELVISYAITVTPKDDLEDIMSIIKEDWERKTGKRIFVKIVDKYFNRHDLR